MTREEAESCIGTIEMLRTLAYNIHGVMDVIDADNCEKIIKALSQGPCDECRYKRTSICGNCKEYDEFEEVDFVQEHKKIPVTLDLTPCDDAISRDFQIGDEVRIIGSDPIYDDCDVGWVIRNASERVKTMYVMRNDGSADEEAKAEWYKTGRHNAMLAEVIKALPSVNPQKSGKWDRLYNWLNDMRLGIAPDETVTDIDERHCRESQTDILDEIMEWMIKAEVEPQESEE